jgi:hypothetical protein
VRPQRLLFPYGDRTTDIVYVREVLRPDITPPRRLFSSNQLIADQAAIKNMKAECWCGAALIQNKFARPKSA